MNPESAIGNLKFLTGVLIVSVAVGASAVGADAQTRQPPRPAEPARPPSAGAVTIDEATILTNGWSLLAQGLVQDAYRKASEALADYPRSGAALSLAVEASIAQGGAAAGLAQDEQWLGSRTLEEPAILRTVATALLREASADAGDAVVRLAALKALTADGDAAAGAALSDAAQGANPEARTLASLGSRGAVDALVAQLATSTADKARILQSLGDSGSHRAAPAVAAQLRDPSEQVRGAALDALARIGTEAQIAAIRPFLQDQSAFIRGRAAAALYRLGDDSGLSVLQAFAQSDSPVTRLIAADAMASRPDEPWLSLVRGLLSAPQPEVRAAAARLLAPHDPDLARSTLESLQNDPNIAIRELASRELGEITTTDSRPAAAAPAR